MFIVKWHEKIDMCIKLKYYMKYLKWYNCHTDQWLCSIFTYNKCLVFYILVSSNNKVVTPVFGSIEFSNQFLGLTVNGLKMGKIKKSSGLFYVHELSCRIVEFFIIVPEDIEYWN